ncbi:MAG TPA: hypothetical protein VIP75_12290 [Acidothermales bacterium]
MKPLPPISIASVLTRVLRRRAGEAGRDAVEEDRDRAVRPRVDAAALGAALFVAGVLVAAVLVAAVLVAAVLVADVLVAVVFAAVRFAAAVLPVFVAVAAAISCTLPSQVADFAVVARRCWDHSSLFAARMHASRASDREVVAVGVPRRRIKPG